MNFYAVKKGRKTGIYNSWKECQEQINGYSDAIFKKFDNEEQAREFLNEKNKEASKSIQNDNDKAILLFTDGGSRNHGNRPGEHVKKTDKAAWAFLIRRNGHNVKGVGGEYGATNNKMELTALIHGLRIIGQRGWNNEKIIATLDSKYVLQAIQNGWLSNWQKNNWKKSSGQVVANVELWEKIANLLPHFPNLTFKWTKGHADNKGNIIVDQLLNKKMDEM